MSDDRSTGDLRNCMERPTMRWCGVLLIVSATASCVAGAAIACATAAEIVTHISSEMPGVETTIIEGAAAEGITMGISSITGNAMAPGGSYVLAGALGMSSTYVVRLVAGCATHHGRFPRQLVQIWINGQAVENQPND